MGTAFRSRILPAVVTAACLAAHGTFALPQLRSQVLISAAELGDTYDYVIIGGGTAGLTLGDRLSENADSELHLWTETTRPAVYYLSSTSSSATRHFSEFPC